MPPSPDHADIWHAIDSLKDIVASRNEATARLEEQCKPLIEFVTLVRNGGCPWGRQNREAIDKHLSSHTGWTKSAIGWTIALIAASGALGALLERIL